jgi:hypothetical protein
MCAYFPNLRELFCFDNYFKLSIVKKNNCLDCSNDISTQSRKERRGQHREEEAEFYCSFFLFLSFLSFSVLPSVVSVPLCSTIQRPKQLQKKYKPQISNLIWEISKLRWKFSKNTQKLSFLRYFLCEDDVFHQK